VTFGLGHGEVPKEIKNMAEKSSTLLGNTNLTEFGVQAIRGKATQVLKESNAIALSNQQFDDFMAVCKNPGKPSNKLLKAAKSFDDTGYK